MKSTLFALGALTASAQSQIYYNSAQDQPAWNYQQALNYSRPIWNNNNSWSKPARNNTGSWSWSQPSWNNTGNWNQPSFSSPSNYSYSSPDYYEPTDSFYSPSFNGSAPYSNSSFDNWSEPVYYDDRGYLMAPTNDYNYPPGTNTTFPDGSEVTFYGSNDDQYPDYYNDSLPGMNATYPDGTEVTYYNTGYDEPYYPEYQDENPDEYPRDVPTDYTDFGYGQYGQSTTYDYYGNSYYSPSADMENWLQDNLDFEIFGFTQYDFYRAIQGFFSGINGYDISYEWDTCNIALLHLSSGHYFLRAMFDMVMNGGGFDGVQEIFGNLESFADGFINGGELDQCYQVFQEAQFSPSWLWNHGTFLHMRALKYSVMHMDSLFDNGNSIFNNLQDHETYSAGYVIGSMVNEMGE